MNILDHINGALNGFLTKAGQAWHTTVEPWLSTLMTGVVHAEVTALMPVATQAVAELSSHLIAAHGNLSDFSTVAGQVLANTAQKAQAAAITAGGASLLTAVNAAIAGHGAQAAAAAVAAPAP